MDRSSIPMNGDLSLPLIRLKAKISSILAPLVRAALIVNNMTPHAIPTMRIGLHTYFPVAMPLGQTSTLCGLSPEVSTNTIFGYIGSILAVSGTVFAAGAKIVISELRPASPGNYPTRWFFTTRIWD